MSVQIHLGHMYKMQAELDDFILSKVVTDDFKYPRDIYVEFAYQQELAELFNEVRDFKYWSQKPPSPKKVLREEWADCLHFLLSLILARELEEDITRVNVRMEAIERLQLANKLRYNQLTTTQDIQEALNDLFLYGMKLGLRTDQMISAYKEKNLINIQRQENGY